MSARTCAGCGILFRQQARNQTRCKPKCGLRKSTATDFIAVDGEGVTYPDGRHDYVCLSVGSETLDRNGERLDTLSIFRFLYEQYAESPDSAFVGFYLSYDFSQWLKDLPREKAWMLLSDEGIAKRTPSQVDDARFPWPVRWGGWEFDILHMRRFKLRPGEDNPDYTDTGWLYVCDSGPFWQTSFMSAIDPRNWGNDPVVSPEQYDVIRQGKKDRSAAVFGPSMIRYNRAENAVLSEAMRRLDKGFRANGWQLRRNQWFGPGQIADAWLKSVNAPKREDIEEVTPQPALDAARAAYYGGWFEIPRHGLVKGTSYEYDINSAYPYIIAELPCLLHGSWRHVREPRWVNPPSSYVLVKCRTRGYDTFLGGLPHRNDDGIISRPLQTDGWYWWHEVSASRDAKLITNVSIREAWVYEPCPCPRPFKAIRDLYQQRLAIGKNTAAGKALKLCYNSAYGKFAQSVGRPKYANAVYASLITAGCRTMILDAIATHPARSAAVLMVATDGVYFRTPHPSLNIDGQELGAWDTATKENLCLFMPGVYWDDKARAALKIDGSPPQLKSRGINAYELASHIAEVDSRFADPFTVWPSVRIPVGFSVITANLALARNRWYQCGSVVTDGAKDLSSDPINKRDPIPYYDESGLLTTIPYSWHGPSVPYSRRFGQDIEALIDNDALMTDDGTINQELAELLGQK